MPLHFSCSVPSPLIRIRLSQLACAAAAILVGACSSYGSDTATTAAGTGGGRSIPIPPGAGGTATTVGAGGTAVTGGSAGSGGSAGLGRQRGVGRKRRIGRHCGIGRTRGIGRHCRVGRHCGVGRKRWRDEPGRWQIGRGPGHRARHHPRASSRFRPMRSRRAIPVEATTIWSTAITNVWVQTWWDSKPRNRPSCHRTRFPAGAVKTRTCPICSPRRKQTTEAWSRR